MRTRLWLAASIATALSGCGSIAYDDGAPSAALVEETSGYTTCVVAEPPPPGQVVIVAAPAPPVAAAPSAAWVVAPAPAPPSGPWVVAPEVAAPARQVRWSRGDGPIHCAGADHIRVDDVVIDGGDGPAVLATGQCLVEVSEAIVRGAPAVVVRDGARVRLVESRVEGDVIGVSAGSIELRGSRHRGRLLTGL